MKINCMIGITDSKGNRINTSCDVCPKYDSCSVRKFEMGLKQQEKSVNTFSFESVLSYLKEGYTAIRRTWPKGKLLVMQKGYPEGIPCNEQTAKTWGLNEGDLFKCAPYLQINEGDMHYMYAPSIEDLFAEDWFIIFNKEIEIEE